MKQVSKEVTYFSEKVDDVIFDMLELDLLEMVDDFLYREHLNMEEMFNHFCGRVRMDNENVNPMNTQQ